MSLLEKHKFKIDFETNQLISSEGNVKIKANRPTICQLILSRNTFTIEPFSNVTYRFKPESPIHSLNAIVECQGRFKVSESIVNTDEEIEILLENLTPIKQTIRPFTILGKLSNQKDLCKFISNDLKVEEICTIRASPNQEPWKPSSVMEFKDQSLSSDQIDSLKTLIDKYWQSKFKAVKHVELALKELARKCLRNGVYKVSFPNIWQSLGWNYVARIINDTLIRNGIECFVFENIQDMEEGDILSINNKIGRLQDRDKEISDLIEKVKAQQMEGFRFEDGVLLKVRRENVGVLEKLLVVPKDLRPDILKMCHDNFMG
ncbi:hypothetical protein BpHYR1_051838, partial [Brachionus plicatilis]